MFKKICLAGFILLLSFSLSAQRQTYGRHSLEVYGTFNKVNPFHFFVSGGGFSWSVYGYDGYPVAGAEAFSVPLKLVYDELKDGEGNLLLPREEYNYNATEVVARGGYMLRLWAPRSRVVVFSAGASLGAGVRVCKELSGHVKVYDSEGTPTYFLSTGFLLNFIPQLQAEVFPLRNVSATFAFQPHMAIVSGIGGDVDWFRPQLTFGVKYYL